jgi:hypothetical protein
MKLNKALGNKKLSATSKKVAIVQSNYIPWKGYFDVINWVDEFILYDDAQYTRRDWRNRNRIKSSKGIQWLTVPVETKNKYAQKIKDAVVSDPQWGKKHWKSILHNYAQAKHFPRYREMLEGLFLGTQERFLSLLNYHFIKACSEILGIRTKISWSMDYHLGEGRTERLVGLCQQSGASEYLSGPAAKGYLDESLFHAEGITVTYMDYSGYPEYEQLFPPFEHAVSVLDLIFNMGPEAPKYMKSFGHP